ncbi:MAG: efflux RND transporter periplasmic adaptor subunit [Planctomycetota bacterium]
MSGFTTSSSPQPAYPSTAEVIEELSRFDGPPEEFLHALLAAQCCLTAAHGGAVFRVQDTKADVIAVHPPVEEGGTLPVWIARAGESVGEVVSSGGPVIKSMHDHDVLYGESSGEHLVMIPLQGGPGLRGFTAFHVCTRDPKVLDHARERLELTASLLGLYEMRLTLQRRQGDLSRLKTSMQVLAAVNDHRAFQGAAMALCNEMAARFNAHRVSLGMLDGRYVKLKAMSDTEKFDRKTESVRAIEQAMEECIDQDVELIHPVFREVTVVTRATRELAERFGPATILSLPLRSEGQAVGVLLIERPPDWKFAAEDIEAIRLTTDLCSARIEDLHQSDRWVGARAAQAAREGLATLVGPKHTWIKLLALALTAVVAFMVLVRGPYRAEGSFEVEAVQRRVVPARFRADLAEVYVEVGDRVVAGQKLAQLDASELITELADARAKLTEHLQAAEVGRTQGERQIALSKAKSVQAQIDDLQRRIDQATITAPIGGTITEGDLKQLIDKDIEKGQVLFRIAALDRLRAEVAVPEDQIADVEKALTRAREDGGQLTGQLAVTQHPEQRMEFVVEGINPVGRIKNQQNVFLVRVRLKEQPGWLKPGMGGSARITVDHRPYGAIWTRSLVNWIRMTLWI